MKVMPIFATNARANFVSAYGRKDLPAALKNIKLLEQGAKHFEPNEIATHFNNAAKLCLDHGKAVQAFQFSVKAYRRAADLEIKIESIKILHALADGCVKHKEIADQLKPQLNDLLKNTIRQTVGRMTAREADEWAMVIDTLDRHIYHVEQKLLIEVFLPTLEPGGARAEVAARYLEKSMLAERYCGVKRDQEKAANCATILINEGKTIISECSSRDFFMVIATLDHFDQLDRIKQAMALRQPNETDPVQFLVKLILGRHNDLEATFLSLKNSNKQYETFSLEMMGEIKNIQARIVRQYLDQHLKDQVTPTMALPWSDRMLYQPFSSDQLLYEKLSDYLNILLEYYAKPVHDLEPFWLALRVRLSEQYEGHAYIVYLPVSKEFVVYFDDKNENRWIKVVFPTGEKRVHQVFVGDPRKEPQVGVMVRTAMFLAQSYTDISAGNRQRINAQAEKAAQELTNAIGRLFKKINAEVYNIFSSALAADHETQNRVVEMHNRLHLARTIFEKYIKQVKEENYALQPDDLLNPLIKSIAFYPAEKLAEMMKECGLPGLAPNKEGKYPFAVGLKPRADEAKEILCIIRSPKNITVPGHGELTGTEAEFVYDLVYEAAVKLSIKTAAESLQQTGYLFNKAGEEAAGLVRLKQIFNHYFKIEMAKKGLLAFDWFFFEKIGDDGLFHPFPDQSIEAKRELFAKGNLDNIFAKTELEGLAMLLPVRKKRVAGKIKLAPWERQPLREKQQAILGDTRVLPVYYGLYVLTDFSDGKAHAFRYLIKTTEAEIMDDALVADVQQRLADGFFKDPQVFLKGTPKNDRALIEAGLASGQFTILGQEVEVFQLNTTFKRPTMEKLSDLLAQGYTLEPQEPN